MIPHTQTILIDDPSGRPGNCLQASIAALLDLPLDEVPHFVEISDDEGLNWFLTMLDWFAERGKKVALYDDRFRDFTILTPHYAIGPLNLAPSGRLMIACGPSPRGVSHAVLWKSGTLVHDPHPSREGLVKVEWLYDVTDGTFTERSKS